MPSLRSRILHRTLHRVTGALDTRLSIQEQRTRMDELSRRGIRLPKGVAVRSIQAGNVHAEWLTPFEVEPQATILYLHGGGYCICSPDTHRGLAARLALASKSRLLLLEYRLAPEHPFPAALEDALAAYRWLLAEGASPANLIIAGDSAGGGLTLATAFSLRASGEPLPSALALISPWTDLTFSGETVSTLGKVDPVLKFDGRPLVDYYTNGRLATDPLISPLFGDLQGLPPIFIQVGSDEILLSDSTRLAEKAQATGVDTQLEIWPGMWHVFQVFAPYLPEAQQAIDQMGAFIRRGAV
jgi:acetyl esterase/lipase